MRMDASCGNNSDSNGQKELENNIEECGSAFTRMDARGWISLSKNNPVDQEDMTQVCSSTSTRMDTREQISLISPLPGGNGVKSSVSQGAGGEISWASLGVMPKSVGKVKSVVGTKSNPCGRGSRGRTVEEGKEARELWWMNNSL